MSRKPRPCSLDSSQTGTSQFIGRFPPLMRIMNQFGNSLLRSENQNDRCANSQEEDEGGSQKHKHLTCMISRGRKKEEKENVPGAGERIHKGWFSLKGRGVRLGEVGQTREGEREASSPINSHGEERKPNDLLGHPVRPFSVSSHQLLRSHHSRACSMDKETETSSGSQSLTRRTTF